MKKVSTLVTICVLVTVSSFAQWGNGQQRHDNRDYRNNGYNNDQYRINRFRTEDELLRDMNLGRSQERKISKINEQFRQKAYYLQNERARNIQQKTWQLERLEQQRKQDILNVLSGMQRERYNAWCVKNNTGTTYGTDGKYGQGNGRW